MIFLPRNKSKDTNRKRIWLAFSIFIIGAVLFSFVDGLAMRVASPFWKSEKFFLHEGGDIISLFKSKEALVDENRALKETVANYESLLVSLRSVETRNDALMASIGRSLTNQEILAAVLVHPPLTAYDNLIVDVGSNAQVGVGAQVNLPNGSALGVVTEVFDKVSRVKLFTSGGEKTNAVLERHQIPVILLGQGGGNFKLALPRDTEVMVGDRVIDPSIQSRLLGVVEEVSMSPTDSFKEVFVRGPQSIFSLRFVVITK